jgi:hypothetical protein
MRSTSLAVSSLGGFVVRLALVSVAAGGGTSGRAATAAHIAKLDIANAKTNAIRDMRRAGFIG